MFQDFQTCSPPRAGEGHGDIQSHRPSVPLRVSWDNHGPEKTEHERIDGKGEEGEGTATRADHYGPCLVIPINCRGCLIPSHDVQVPDTTLEVGYLLGIAIPGYGRATEETERRTNEHLILYISLFYSF